MTAGVTPDADHGWLAKVLAGDPLHLSLLDLARTLWADGLDALMQCGKRIKAGMPAADAAVLARQEAGQAVAGSDAP